MVAIERIRQDIRYALRTMARNRSFAVVAIATLALGIGATTAIFSVVNAILLRPLPYANPDRVVHIVTYKREGNKTVRSGAGGMAQRFFVGLRERTHTLAAVGGYDSFSNLTRQRLAMLVDGRDGAAQLLGTRMSPVLFTMLGARTTIGRLFEPAEEQPAHHDVMLLSERAWRTYYGGTADILGKSLTLDHRAYTIVGVLPADFHFPDRFTDFWIPMTPAQVPPPSAPRSDTPNSGYTDATFGLLAAGVSSQAASAEVEAILRQLDKERAAELRWTLEQIGFPAWLPRRGEASSMKEELVGPIRPALRVFAFAVGLVLLIACANVLTLWLARMMPRERELATRSALGATRGRLIQQLVTETLVLAVCGGAFGVLLAYWLVDVIVRFAPRDIPRIDEVGLDVRALSVALALSCAAGLVIGIMPGLHARWRKLIVVAEIAMAMMLFVGAALLIRSFVTLINVDLGYDARNVVAFQVVLPAGRFADPNEVYGQLIERLEAIPSVRAAGATDVLPIAGTGGFHFALSGLPIAPGPGDTMVMRVVTRHYFDAMGVRFLEGRTFSEPAAGRPGVVINRELAERYFGGNSPVGRIVGESPHTYEVVGVVDNVRHAGLQASVEAEYYVDLRDFALAQATRPYFAVRGRQDTSGLPDAIRTAVRQVDPRVGVDLNMAEMSDIVSASITRPRFYTILLGAFATIAVVLAAIGIYGVTAHSVSQRTREIGIRVALGARDRQVLALILGQGAMITLAGVLAGLGGAALATRYLSAMLFGVAPIDPATFVGVAIALAAVATLASYIPARRATKVDPLHALRYE